MPRLPKVFTSPQSYWQSSRAHRYSLLFALPLLIAYEALAAVLSLEPGGGIRNGADVLLRTAFYTVGGRHGPLLFSAVILGVGVWLIGRDMRARGVKLRPAVFAGMLAESVVLALAFGVVVGGITARILGVFAMLGGHPAALMLSPIQQLDFPTRVMVSLGAGLYEELVFRVILVGGLAWAGRSLLGARPAVAGLVAAVLGALIFSAFHYVGAYGDRWELQSFTFRFIGGLAFSALFLLRGFGITAWTHALYDVFLLLL
ncbi:MAG TPA: CPBP family glutamic-type intramembrane protease [Gemmatimonadaceae bacterium]|nr:CPBP family glutamic-type intramembrane protease [Gemmatimonadaceae bacterium]